MPLTRVAELRHIGEPTRANQSSLWAKLHCLGVADSLTCQYDGMARKVHPYASQSWILIQTFEGFARMGFAGLKLITWSQIQLSNGKTFWHCLTHRIYWTWVLLSLWPAALLPREKKCLKLWLYKTYSHIVLAALSRRNLKTIITESGYRGKIFMILYSTSNHSSQASWNIILQGRYQVENK